jgi:hypothetical protein
MLAVFVMTATGFTLNPFVGSEPAAADVPNSSIAHVFLDLNGQTSDTLRSQYLAFLRSLRAAAGHQFRSGVAQTQTDTTNRLIRVDINHFEHRMSLWLTPNNLYVVGFTNADGLSWDFNDNAERLDETMFAIQRNGGSGPGNGGNLASPQQYQGQLRFGGNYNSLTRAADRGRENMPISFTELTRVVDNLATIGNPDEDARTVARSLMFMIQFTSEAARFWDVQSLMWRALGRQGSNPFPGPAGPSFDGLPTQTQALENAWDRISQYAYQITQNPRTGRTLLVAGLILRNFFDVQRVIAQLIGATNQVPLNFKPDRSEL